jgi:hypothetical protein
MFKCVKYVTGEFDMGCGIVELRKLDELCEWRKEEKKAYSLLIYLDKAI